MKPNNIKRFHGKGVSKEFNEKTHGTEFVYKFKNRK